MVICWSDVVSLKTARGDTQRISHGRRTGLGVAITMTMAMITLAETYDYHCDYSHSFRVSVSIVTIGTIRKLIPLLEGNPT